jgi:hypothetical protein
MARANLRDTRVRAALEGIAAELAVIKDTSPITRLRMMQAMQRTGLVGLMSPALDELDDMSRAVQEAQTQVSLALAVLIDKDDATHVY